MSRPEALAPTAIGGSRAEMVCHPALWTFVLDMLHFKVGHQRRSLTLIGLSLSVLAVAAAAYLVPGVLHLSGQPQAPSPTPQWQLLSASFDGVDHGAVTMIRTTGRGQLTINPPSSVATYLTSDGARTWKRLRHGVAFTSFLERDYAVISYLDRRSFDITADGGRTWTSVAWSEVPAVGKVRMGSAGGAWGLGRFEGPVFLDRANVWWLTAGPGPAPGPVALWRSSDGTRTWTHVSAIGVPNDQLVGVPTFIDQLRGAMVVVPTSTPDGWPSLVTTRDGGETWQPATLPEPLAAGVHLAVPDPQSAVLLAHDGRLVLSLNLLPTGVAAGFGPPGDVGNHAILHWSSLSEDWGRTWKPWTIEPAMNFLASGAITFDDKDHLLLADDRRLWTSSDYGRTWQGRSLPLPMNVHAVDLLATRADGLVIAGWRGPTRIPGDLVLLRSRDRGAHWSEVPLPLPEHSPDGG